MDRPAVAVVSLVSGLFVVLLAAGPARSQGTPLPVPGGPGGAQPPIYSEPGPTTPRIESPHVGPPRPRPESETSGARGASEPSTAPSPATPGVPRVTAFPELTHGVGNSQALLED